VRFLKHHSGCRVFLSQFPGHPGVLRTLTWKNKSLVHIHYYCVARAAFVSPSFLNSSSMASFTLCLQNSLATRTAFLMALALDRPWQTIVIPFMPSNGAPPYSE